MLPPPLDPVQPGLGGGVQGELQVKHVDVRDGPEEESGRPEKVQNGSVGAGLAKLNQHTKCRNKNPIQVKNLILGGNEKKIRKRLALSCAIFEQSQVFKSHRCQLKH